MSDRAYTSNSSVFSAEQNSKPRITEIHSTGSPDVIHTQKFFPWRFVSTCFASHANAKQLRFVLLLGHPFMTPQGGGQAQVDASGRVSGQLHVRGRPRKIRAHWRHPVLFSCKKVGVLKPEFRLWMEEKVEVFRQHSLVAFDSIFTSAVGGEGAKQTTQEIPNIDY